MFRIWLSVFTHARAFWGLTSLSGNFGYERLVSQCEIKCSLFKKVGDPWNAAASVESPRRCRCHKKYKMNKSWSEPKKSQRRQLCYRKTSPSDASFNLLQRRISGNFKTSVASYHDQNNMWHPAPSRIKCRWIWVSMT